MGVTDEELYWPLNLSVDSLSTHLTAMHTLLLVGVLLVLCCADVEREMKRCLVESFKKVDEDFLLEAKQKWVSIKLLQGGREITVESEGKVALDEDRQQ